MIALAQVAYSLPPAPEFILPVTAPIFQEIITKFVPVAAAFLVGFTVIKRFFGGR